MTFKPKSAKDLPAGAEVMTRRNVWTKQPGGLWTNGPGRIRTNTEVDDLLASGGVLMRVPVARANELEASRD